MLILAFDTATEVATRAVVDARRREVFATVDGEHVVASPAELRVEGGRMCVGSGAVRYRGMLAQQGAIVPPDDDERHVPRARFHVRLARDFGPVEAIEPL